VIEVAALCEGPWPDIDWESLAQRAAEAAIAASPQAALTATAATIEIAVRLTSDDQVQTLNRQYRTQDKPTNVLSFPMVQPDLIESMGNADDGEILLGDIALAYGVCARESREKGVTLEDHAAHLIVHGVLHLLGHDHMNDVDADAMEAIERAAMASLGLHDPYQDFETPK
jgi:probable rRNA maturation factor